jgi:hypothetical protein
MNQTIDCNEQECLLNFLYHVGELVEIIEEKSSSIAKVE